MPLYVPVVKSLTTVLPVPERYARSWQVVRRLRFLQVVRKLQKFFRSFAYSEARAARHLAASTLQARDAQSQRFTTILPTWHTRLRHLICFVSPVGAISAMST